MSYWIHVLPAAQEDLELIVDRLLAKAATAAANWIEAYEQALATLAEEPERQAFSMEAKRLRLPIRDLLFKTSQGHRYRLIYLVVGDEVRVLRIRAPGQPFLRKKDFE